MKSIYSNNFLLFKIFLHRIPTSLAIISLFCLTVLTVKIYALDDMPEFFNGAHKIGLVFENILLSITSSFVFFITLNSYSEAKKELKKLDHIKNEAWSVISGCQRIIRALIHNTVSGEIIIHLEKLESHSETLKSALEKRTVSGLWHGMMSNRSDAHPTWLEFINYEINDAKIRLEKIERYRDIYDDSTMSAVDGIIDSGLFKQISWWLSANLKMDQPLTVLHHFIMDYGNNVFLLEDNLSKRYGIRW